MSRIILVLSVLLGLMPLGCNSAKDIQGKVTDPENNPIAGATIKLLVWDQKKADSPSKIIDTVQTGQNGDFAIDVGGESPETKLVISVEKEGYKLAILKFTPQMIGREREVFKNYKVILEKK